MLLAIFLVIESRVRYPLMPFSIFRVRTLAGANVAGLLLGAVVFANFFILTLYVQNVLGWSALRTGVTFVATAGSAVLWAGVAQALVTRIGAKIVMAVGFVAHDGRNALVHADPGRRVVLRPTCSRLLAGRLRAAVLVHPGLDRRARRRRASTRRGSHPG